MAVEGDGCCVAIISGKWKNNIYAHQVIVNESECDWRYYRHQDVNIKDGARRDGNVQQQRSFQNKMYMMRRMQRLGFYFLFKKVEKLLCSDTMTVQDLHESINVTEDLVPLSSVISLLLA